MNLKSKRKKPKQTPHDEKNLALKNELFVKSKVSETYVPVELTSFNIIHRRRRKHLIFWWRIFNIVWNLSCISHLLLLLLYARLDFTASFGSVCKSKRFLITRWQNARKKARKKARIQGIQYLKLWNYLSCPSKQHH